MKNDLYVQCLLTRGTEVDKSWIPADLAVVGQSVNLKEGDDWTNGWKVKEAYTSAKVSWEYLNERGQDYKRTRRASDI